MTNNNNNKVQIYKSIDKSDYFSKVDLGEEKKKRVVITTTYYF